MARRLQFTTLHRLWSTLASGRDGFGSRCVTSVASRACCPTLMPTALAYLLPKMTATRPRPAPVPAAAPPVRGRTRGGVPQQSVAELIPAGHDQRQKAGGTAFQLRSRSQPAGLAADQRTTRSRWPTTSSPRAGVRCRPWLKTIWSRCSSSPGSTWLPIATARIAVPALAVAEVRSDSCEALRAASDPVLES